MRSAQAQAHFKQYFIGPDLKCNNIQVENPVKLLNLNFQRRNKI